MSDKQEIKGMAQEKDIDIAPAPKKSSKLILFIALGMFGLLVL